MSISSIVKTAAGIVAFAAIACGVNRYFSRDSRAINLQPVASKAVAACTKELKARALMEKVEKSTDLQSPYSVTLPLLGAAYSNDKKRYEKWETALFNAFKIDRNASANEMVNALQEKGSENAWLLGRLMVANMRMGDTANAQKVASVIEVLLKNSQPDPFAAWAFGYLGIYSVQAKPEEYPAVRDRMIECTDALMAQPGEKGKDNVLWALVMELQSLSEPRDGRYRERLQKLPEFSGTASVVEALASIPPGDFRAWATSLVLRAAKKAGDLPLVKALKEYLPITISESPSDGDKMLALRVSCSS